MISALTAIIIQTQGENIRCDAWQDNLNKQWVGVVDLYRDGNLHTTLLESGPLYGSREAAIQAMEEHVRKIREMS